MSKATEAALDQAILDHCRDEELTGIITGWIVVASVVDHDGDHEKSGVNVLYPHGSMPWPLALGIVEAGRLRMHADYLAGDGE